MEAYIPSYQNFFAGNCFSLGKASLYLVYICKLGDTGSSEQALEYDGQRLVATIEKTWLDGEIAVLIVSQPFKAAVLVKLPCGSLKNPFKPDKTAFFKGRLELWAKPELGLPDAIKTDVEITGLRDENDEGERLASVNI